jgi:hypothetical protein
MNRFVLLFAVLVLFTVPSAQWNFVREVSINNTGALATNAVVQVLLPGNFDYTKAKSAGADIRFSTLNEPVSGLGLPYWIEQWNEGGVGRIWVKVPMLAAQSTTKIFLFYGNATATAVANGESTFLFFDDFEGSSWSEKWKNPLLAEEVIPSVIEQGGMLKLNVKDGKFGKILAKDFQVTGQMVIHSLYQRNNGDGDYVCAGIGGWGHWFAFGDYTNSAHGNANNVMIRDSILATSNVPLIATQFGTINGNWRRITFQFDGSKLKGWEDTTEIAWSISNPGVSYLGLRTFDNDASDNFAFVAVSTAIVPDPVVMVGAQATPGSVSINPRLWRADKIPASLQTRQRLVTHGTHLFSIIGALFFNRE